MIQLIVHTYSVVHLTVSSCIIIFKPDGDAHEVYCCFGEGEIARTVRLLKTPEKREGVALDVFADKRPIIAVVRKGRCVLCIKICKNAYILPYLCWNIIPLL